MKDSEFKRLGHVVGHNKIATTGAAVSSGYKPDVTIVDPDGRLAFILECEQKTDRKAFLGDVMKAQKYAQERHATPTLIIVMQPQPNTTVQQIANHLQPYVSWMHQHMVGGLRLARVAVISDVAYQNSIAAKEQLGSDAFWARACTLVPS